MLNREKNTKYYNNEISQINALEMYFRNGWVIQDYGEEDGEWYIEISKRYKPHIYSCAIREDLSIE
jgi:hypothetical protein